MPIARLDTVAFDCPEPRLLADFYRRILGGEIEEETSAGDWVILRLDHGVDLAFQRDPRHQPPEWPDGTPQQAHLDLVVDDLDAAEREVLAIGAEKAGVQPAPDEWRVFLDPAGHPFCLIDA